MAQSYTTYVGDGTTRTFSIPFPYLARYHVNAFVDGMATDFTFVTDASVEFDTAPSQGSVVRLERRTQRTPMVDFQNGENLTEGSLDRITSQALYLSEESEDGVTGTLQLDTDNTWDTQGRRIKNVSDPDAPQDAVSKQWAETAMSSQLQSAIDAKDNAVAAKETAAEKSVEASDSASTAASKAVEASDSASTATTKASEAGASSAAAGSARVGAETARTEAETARDKAQDWADKAEDATVESGKYSAKHHAAKASASASTAHTKADEADAAKSAAQTAKTEAEEARDQAVAADKVAKSGDTMAGRLGLDIDSGNNFSARAALHVKGTSAANTRAIFERDNDEVAFGSTGGKALIANNHSDGESGGQLHYFNGEIALNWTWSTGEYKAKANAEGVYQPVLDTAAAYGVSEDRADATLNSAKLGTMAGWFEGKEVDLKGRTYPVTELPSMQARNGFWKVVDYMGQADVCFPAKGTMHKTTTALTHGMCNSTWAQDNACWDDGMREGFVAFTENNNHGIDDGSARVVIMRSRDGISWTREVVDLGYPCTVWGHRVYGGFQMIIVRNESGGADQGKFRLYGRQLAQRVELIELENVGAGDDRFRFYTPSALANKVPLMLYEDVEVSFHGLPSNLGGHNLNRTERVSFRSANRFEFRAPSNFTGAFNHSGTFEMNVLETDWFHITFDGGRTLGDELAHAAGVSGEPVLVHGISMWHDGPGANESADFASRGDFYVGVSGGPYNAAVAKVRNIVDNNNKGDVQWVQEIPGAGSQLSEVTVQTFPDSDKLCGFVRTQDHNSGQTTPAAFWSTPNGDTNLGSVALTDLPLGVFEDSPISIARLGDELVAAGTLDRNGDGSRGSRTLALLRASVSGAFSAGANAFQIIPLDHADYNNQTLTNGGAGVGVPSITRWGSNGLTAACFWNRESNSNIPNKFDTVTQLMAAKVSFVDDPSLLYGAEQIAWGSVPEPEWRIKLRGTPAHGDDSVIQWAHVDMQSAPTSYSSGVITFPVSGVYWVSCQMSYEPNDGTNYVKLVEGNGTSDFGGVETWLALAYNDNSTFSVPSAGGSGTLVTAKAGETMAFKLNATGGATSSNVRNYAAVELLRMH
ncbi:hypothetical protein MHM88_11310 [Epibacterium sp. MM17-32]|uniref:phage tail fiber domain-containing protein n=1 Tax=Epibacterium sp. MM17-32 TaxID=2917734 RepID=UPI001EF4042E|nr:phage tail fiber protein [Epibacterium sp. MM17-32]MCG7628396.1 hypothetical protein [Epibacterium sp. MM17-32]